MLKYKENPEDEHEGGETETKNVRMFSRLLWLLMLLLAFYIGWLWQRREDSPQNTPVFQILDGKTAAYTVRSRAVRAEAAKPAAKPEKEKEGAEEESPADIAESEAPAEDAVDSAEDDKVVYLTFDDGPCKTTPWLLETLDALDVKATFFVTGQYLKEEELVARMREIVEKGHGLAVHTYSHRYEEIYASSDAFWEDYERMASLVEEALGAPNRLLRFAGGSNTGKNEKIRQELLEEAARRELIYHDWNSFVGDTQGLSARKMIEMAVEGAKKHERSVMLLHNAPNKDTVIQILPQIVEQLRQEGYRFAVLDETVQPYQFIHVDDITELGQEEN